MVESDESIDEFEESEEDIEEDIYEEDEDLEEEPDESSGEEDIEEGSEDDPDGEDEEYEEDDDEDPQVYEKVQTTTNDLNDIYRDGVAVAKELKGAYDDIAKMFDFKNWLK